MRADEFVAMFAGLAIACGMAGALTIYLLDALVKGITAGVDWLNKRYRRRVRNGAA